MLRPFVLLKLNIPKSHFFAQNRMTYQARYLFASIDPYYILGVDRNVNFEEIKKQYYKLANEFHPDKNKSTNAGKQFILIKESFEQIKQSKGKAIKMDYENPTSGLKKDFESVRPNAQDYKEDFYQEEAEKDHKKYKEYSHFAPNNEEYKDLKESFKNISDIRDIKLRSQDVQMPDASKRFGMEAKRMRLKTFSDGSYLFLAVIIICFGLGFYFINTAHNKSQVKRYQGLIYNMLNKQDFEEELLKDPDILEDVSQNFQQKMEYKQFIQKFEQKKKQSELQRHSQVPVIQSFVSTQDINQYADDLE